MTFLQVLTWFFIVLSLIFNGIALYYNRKARKILDKLGERK